jgi:hypothetical protein
LPGHHPVAIDDTNKEPGPFGVPALLVSAPVRGSAARRRRGALLFVLLLTTVPAAAVAGHAPGAVIQLGGERVRPGAAITVHGSGMSPDEQIQFEIGDAVQALPVGSAPATGDGELDAVLTIPVTTPQGEWEVYARGPDGGVVSTHLSVAGPPLGEESCDGQDRGEICPTLPPVSSVGVPSTSTARPTTTAIAEASPPGPTFTARTLAPPSAPAVEPARAIPPDPDAGAPWLVAAGGGLAIVVLLIVALVLRRRRST